MNVELKQLLFFLLTITALAACAAPESQAEATTVPPAATARVVENVTIAAPAELATLGSVTWPIAAVTVAIIMASLVGFLAYLLLPKVLDLLNKQGQGEHGQQAKASFDKLMTSLANLNTEDVEEAEQHLLDVKTYHDKLVAEVTGFIQEAMSLQVRLSHISGAGTPAARQGALAFYDGSFSALVGAAATLDKIDPPTNDTGDSLVESDQEIVRGQITHYALHARFLLNLVIAARGEMAQASFRLRNVKAGKTLADMNRELVSCQKKLAVGVASPPELLAAQQPAQLSLPTGSE